MNEEYIFSRTGITITKHLGMVKYEVAAAWFVPVESQRQSMLLTWLAGFFYFCDLKF
jgi:hypothetical protein